MGRAFFVGLAFAGFSVVAGCVPQHVIDKELQDHTSRKVGCPPPRLQIQDYRSGMAGFSPSTWQATGCDRQWQCEWFTPSAGSGLPDRMTCVEDEASRHRTIRKIVVDRLALESGCPKEQIKIVSESDWSRGGEQAFRMNACGRFHVCTTAAGRTDCKAAAPPPSATPAGPPSK